MDQALQGPSDDSCEGCSIESIGECRSCGLCRETSTPIGVVEPPADLNSGHEMGLELRHRQTDETNEWSIVRRFNRPEPITDLIELSFNPVHDRIGFLSAEYFWKVLHNDRIGVEIGERLSIGLPPAPQEKPCGAKVQYIHHSGWILSVGKHGANSAKRISKDVAGRPV
jgi:hypothetical protein